MSSAHRHKSQVGRAALVALLTALTLSGCSSARKALGYDKAPPDEFAVVARAPLAQPPDYTLRPPRPGAQRPQEWTTRDEARTALVGAAAPTATATATGGNDFSPGEQLLLAKAGANRADPEIRRKVDEETTALIDADHSFTDKILFWRDKPPPGEVVDAAREAKRLKDNASSGKSATDGDNGSPQIVRGGHKGSLWHYLLDD